MISPTRRPTAPGAPPAPAPSDDAPKVEDYTEPPTAVVAPLPDLANEFGYGETLRFGSFAGIEEFGGEIAIPAEPIGPGASSRLVACRRNRGSWTMLGVMLRFQV